MAAPSRAAEAPSTLFSCSFKRLLHLVIILLTIAISLVASVPSEYLIMRQNIIFSEQQLRVGGSGSDLNVNEQRINALMLREKRALIEAARLNGSYFAAQHSFLDTTARRDMENTESFRIIQKMPKGGVLHTHDEAITSIEWLVKNATYRPNCYMCVDSNYNVRFHFFSSAPENPGCPWKLISQYRSAAADPKAFDQSLHDNITLVTSDPAGKYPNINVVWAKFMDYFSKVESLMLYAPVFEDYLWEGLLQFRQDNVQYLEIRGLLPPVYELDGTTHDPEWVLALYQRVVNSFVQQYPDFTGARFIKTAIKSKTQADILNDVKEALRLYQQYPIMVGYDLVGQEDLLHPLLFYIDALLYPSRQNPPAHLPYFFHAGETNWQDTASDYNLVDALLLNTTRLGHGYALTKHPTLLARVQMQDIAIEVSPISNQVLKLVEDLRNHPVTSLLSQGMPVVISSDDNAAWEALPLTHDFYVTFMTLIGEDTGLATLKQLAKNSIRYSSLKPDEKQAALDSWQRKWDTFISDIISNLPGL